MKMLPSELKLDEMTLENLRVHRPLFLSDAGGRRGEMGPRITTIGAARVGLKFCSNLTTGVFSCDPVVLVSKRGKLFLVGWVLVGMVGIFLKL